MAEIHVPHLGKERKFSFQRPLLPHRSLQGSGTVVETRVMPRIGLDGKKIITHHTIVTLTPELRQHFQEPVANVHS